MKRKIVGGGAIGGAVRDTNYYNNSSDTDSSTQGDIAPDEFIQACFCNMLGGCIDGNDQKAATHGHTFWKTAMADAGVASDELNNQRSTETADAALVKELNQLSVHERQHVYEDVHGISDRDKKETPELIESSMKKLEASLRKIPTSDARRKIYSKAIFLRPTYFKSTEFLLPFLRKNDFDAKKTTQRVLEYLQFRHELFGLDGLVSTYLRYDEDVTDGAKRYIEMGRLQLLSQPDRSDRPILVVFPKLQAPNYHFLDGVIAYWWLFDTMRRLCNTKKGVVMVLYDSGIRFKSFQQEELTKKYYFNMDGLKAATRFISSVSVFFSAIHYCYDNAKLATPMNTFQAVIGRNARVRFRSHCASPTECLYTLMTFGINTKDFPVDEDGNVLTARHSKWLEQCRVAEKELSAQLTKVIELNREEMVASKSRKAKLKAGEETFAVTVAQYPQCASIILGRGFHEHQHPGNQRLAETVDRYWGTHQGCSWKEKMELTIQIMDDIKASGGMFLMKYKDHLPTNNYCWIQVDDAKAREKVSHAFRNRTLQLKDGKATKPKHDDERDDKMMAKGSAFSSAPSTVSSSAGPTYVPTNHLSNGDYQTSIVSAEELDKLDILNDEYIQSGVGGISEL